MKTQTKKAIKWLDSLSKTRVKQGVGKLGESKNGYCCMGWGCKLLGIDYEPSNTYSKEFSDLTGVIYAIKGGEGDNKIGDMNDELMYSFRKIAKEIKKDPQTYFHPEVAEEIEKHYGQ